MVRLLERSIDERFMNPKHRGMGALVEDAAMVLPTIQATPRWREDARTLAVAR